MPSFASNTLLRKRSTAVVFTLLSPLALFLLPSGPSASDFHLSTLGASSDYGPLHALRQLGSGREERDALLAGSSGPHDSELSFAAHHPPSGPPSHPAACSPYHTFGHLSVDPKVPEHNVFKPFDEECVGPLLLRSMRAELGVESEAVKELEKENGSDWKREDVSYMRGKTVLWFGDSTMRNQLTQFCGLLGEQFRIIGKNDNADRERSLPHSCYVPKLDFLVISVFHYGMDEEDFWKMKDMFIPPGKFEDRLEEIVKPLAADLEALLPTRPDPSVPKRQFDLIEVGSGLWDLARFAKIDTQNDRSTIDDLSSVQLQWWRSRVFTTVSAVVEAFPKAKVVFRSMHYPSDKNAKLDWFLGPGADTGDGSRPFFHTNRIFQLDQAARSAILSPGIPGVEYNEWGSMLLGQHAHQQDQIHPAALPAGWLGGDIMLYELREVSRRQPDSHKKKPSVSH